MWIEYAINNRAGFFNLLQVKEIYIDSVSVDQHYAVMDFGGDNLRRFEFSSIDVCAELINAIFSLYVHGDAANNDMSVGGFGVIKALHNESNTQYNVLLNTEETEKPKPKKTATKKRTTKKAK